MVSSRKGWGSLCVLAAAGMVAAAAPATAVELRQSRGALHLLSAGAEPAALPGVAAQTPAQTAAYTALDLHARRFGIGDPRAQLKHARTNRAADGRSSVRYKQLHQGVPVFGGELVVNLAADRRLLSVNGKVAQALSLGVKPSYPAASARQTALATVAKHEGVAAAVLEAAAPTLAVYDPRLLRASTATPRLVWQLEVRAVPVAYLRYLVLVDAHTGAILLAFNQTDTVKNRHTYTANSTGTYPGTLVCNESQPTCSNGANPEADFVHRFMGDSYDFYMSLHGRDSFDAAGATIISTIDWFIDGVCPNAFWDGTQMVYCHGAAQADDVVGHELTHAVTQYTSGLIYAYESGAINESLSDIWGEFIDLANGAGTDTSGVRWLMGEDFAGLGAIRSMSNPPLYGQPDSMTSPYYYNGSGDNGGVHINSGVNNKVAYLLTDGGTFNGHTVSALGMEKTARIYYEAQTNLLTPSSDFGNLYDILYQACQNLIGSHGIGSADCQQVRNATDAVVMNYTPPAGATQAAVCESGSPDDLFFDTLETSPSGRWSFAALSGSNQWYWASGTGTAGSKALGVAGPSSVSDAVVAKAGDLQLPANAYLHFNHSFSFEYTATTLFDAGVVEYSTDGGSTWIDAAGLYQAGKAYGGTVSSSYGNPLANRQAFGADSGGYVSTRYNLSSLAGQSVRFRFRAGSDSSVASTGWTVDDIRIYTCVVTSSEEPPPNTPPSANAGTDQSVKPGAGVQLDGSASSDADGTIVSYAWTQLGGVSVSLAGADSAAPSFTAPMLQGPEVLSFRLTVTDNGGLSASDDVQVTVYNAPPQLLLPTATQGTAGQQIGIVASASDSDGSIVGYAWTQVSGEPLSLMGVTTDTVSFVVPEVSSVKTAVIQVTVTDSDGGSVSGQTSVTLNPRSSSGSSGGGGGGGGSLPPWLPLALAALALLRRARIGRESST